jgi:hypothetical protein
MHDEHLTFLQEEERRFVTPEAIPATCLAGEPEEIIERIRELDVYSTDSCHPVQGKPAT